MKIRVNLFADFFIISTFAISTFCQTIVFGVPTCPMYIFILFINRCFDIYFVWYIERNDVIVHIKHHVVEFHR